MTKLKQRVVIRNMLRRIYHLLVLFGFDPVKTIRTVKGLPAYLNDLFKFKMQNKKLKSVFQFGKLSPCFDSKHFQDASGSYFHQDLLVARKIFSNNPKKHIDIGSSISGFIAHVATFRELELFDIRELRGHIANVKFTKFDLMSDLSEDLIDYCDSLSCLHVLEHLGLGRYGDKIMVDGYVIGLKNLYKILKKDGKFYFSVPMGPQRVEFNSHRVFSLKYLLDLLNGQFKIDTFSFVDDSGDLHEGCEIDE